MIKIPMYLINIHYHSLIEALAIQLKNSEVVEIVLTIIFSIY